MHDGDRHKIGKAPYVQMFIEKVADVPIIIWSFDAHTHTEIWSLIDGNPKEPRKWSQMVGPETFWSRKLIFKPFKLLLVVRADDVIAARRGVISQRRRRSAALGQQGDAITVTSTAQSKLVAAP